MPTGGNSTIDSISRRSRACSSKRITCASGAPRKNICSKAVIVWGEGRRGCSPDVGALPAMNWLSVNPARPLKSPANMTLQRCSLCAEHSEEEVRTNLGIFEAAGKAVGGI